MGIILKPFAWLLLTLYNLVGSYGLALILFAVIVKLILFPVTLQSKKSMIKTSMLSGKMQQLQKQYGKDRERYNLEVQKLYEKEKVNPMGGCLWSLIPLFVLIGLFSIIREPMTYFMDLTADQIVMIAEQLDWQSVAVANKWVSADAMATLVEKVASGDATTVFQNNGYNQVYLTSLINEGNVASLQSLVGSDKVMPMNFQFLGLDLSAIPNWKFWQGGISWNSIGLFLLAIVSMISSWASMKVTMATNKMNNQQENASVDQTNKMMTWMMPIMSLWIGFTVPAALSIYWICQYLVTMVQEVICGKMLKKDYEAARVAAEKRAQEEKEEEKRRKEEARLERARRIEEEKNSKKKKGAKKKDDEPDREGINKDDSREGLRAYARGRSYMPDRFGGVTPYVDPNTLVEQSQKAAEEKKNKKSKKDEPKPEEKPVDQTLETPVVEEVPSIESADVDTTEAAVAEDRNEEV